jgi:hypothetical protein
VSLRAPRPTGNYACVKFDALFKNLMQAKKHGVSFNFNAVSTILPVVCHLC